MLAVIHRQLIPEFQTIENMFILCEMEMCVHQTVIDFTQHKKKNKKEEQEEQEE